MCNQKNKELWQSFDDTLEKAVKIAQSGDVEAAAIAAHLSIFREAARQLGDQLAGKNPEFHGGPTQTGAI